MNVRTWWKGIRRARRRSDGAAQAWAGLETLESRQLLSVVLTEPIGDQVLMGPSNTSIATLGDVFDETNTVVKFQLPDSFQSSSQFPSQKTTLHVQLRDDVAPNTVANFLNYIATQGYNHPTRGDTIIHRSVPGFIVQGGGFAWDGTDLQQIPTDDPVANEFNGSNLRGTMAMAKIGGDPDSATSQWFFNLDDNSSTLDGQNGGFTVFADVLFDGMDVVDAIAAVPIYDGRSFYTSLGYPFASALGEIPLVDFAGGVPTTGNYVEFIDISVDTVDPLTYTIQNSRPDLLTAFIKDGQVHLKTKAKVAGTAEITVTAEDIHGNTVDTTFEVDVFGKKATFMDNDGDEVALRLRYGGWFFIEPSSADPGAGMDLTLIGTKGKSELKITAAGGDGLAEFDSITADSKMGKIIGNAAVLRGDAAFDQSVKLLNLQAVTGPSTITLGAGPMAKLKLGDVTDLSIDATGGIKLIKVNDWMDIGNDDAVHATHVKKIRSLEGFDPAVTLTGAAGTASLGKAVIDAGPGPGAWDITGKIGRLILGSAPAGWSLVTDSKIRLAKIFNDFAADWTAERIIEMLVLGDVTDATIGLTQVFDPRRTALPLLDVSGAVSATEIRSTANVGKVVATRFLDSILFAGVDAAVSTLPDAPADFIEPAKIKKFILRDNGAGDDSFAGSHVAASRVAVAKLRDVQPMNGSVPFGIAAQSLAKWKWTIDGKNSVVENENQLAGEDFSEDFLARLV